MSDLVRKEIHSIYKTKTPTEEQVRKYTRKWKEYFNDDPYIYVRNDLMEKVIMHCRVASLKSIEFKNKLGLSHNNITLKKEQAVVISILKSIPGIKIMRQYSVLNDKYKIDTTCQIIN